LKLVSHGDSLEAVQEVETIRVEAKDRLPVAPP
jgi:hypothetical protein